MYYVIDNFKKATIAQGYFESLILPYVYAIVPLKVRQIRNDFFKPTFPATAADFVYISE